MRISEPGAPAQQLPAPLAAVTAHQIPILAPPGLPTFRLALSHGIGMPAVFTPLEELPMQLGQAPAVHQSACPADPGLFRVRSLAALAKDGRGVVLRPAPIQRVAEMERCGSPRPAGTLPFPSSRCPPPARRAGRAAPKGFRAWRRQGSPPVPARSGPPPTPRPATAPG